MRQTLSKVFRLTLLLLVSAGLLLILTQEWPNRTADDYHYRRIVHNRRFDFVCWELDALGRKLLYSLAPPHGYVSQQGQKTIVLRFLDRLRELQSLEGQLTEAYADPTVVVPESATADLRRRLLQARQQFVKVQPLAEGVLEEQIAAVAADEGITLAGRTFPPVKLRFTPLPLMLVVSPRDHIETIRSTALEHGLETPEQVSIETAVDEKLDVSSLIVSIGGLGAYPAMILQSSSLNWILEVGAHEWTHHYLTLHPLGVRYDKSPELRTMNETVASIVGEEIGTEVVRRYYPELIPPPPVQQAEPDPEAETQAFDFGTQMRITRVRVDALLAQGDVEEAEAYMEARRLVFWEQGHQIRKLNQAYFAFYGAYADEPGAPGDDPVGPAVLELRARSRSLREFLDTISPLTSFAELEAVLGD